MLARFLLNLLLILCCLPAAMAQQPVTPPARPIEGPSLTAPKPVQTDSVMVTVILKHQQDKNLTEIRRILEAQGFWDIFPPDDARVLSWTIAMGLGHIITLVIPAGSVRRLHLAVENGAWSAYNTEIYLTYDYRPIWKEYMLQKEAVKDEDDDK